MRYVPPRESDFQSKQIQVKLRLTAAGGAPRGLEGALADMHVGDTKYVLVYTPKRRKPAPKSSAEVLLNLDADSLSLCKVSLIQIGAPKKKDLNKKETKKLPAAKKSPTEGKPKKQNVDTQTKPSPAPSKEDHLVQDRQEIKLLCTELNRRIQALQPAYKVQFGTLFKQLVAKIFAEIQAGLERSKLQESDVQLLTPFIKKVFQTHTNTLVNQIKNDLTTAGVSPDMAQKLTVTSVQAAIAKVFNALVAKENDLNQTSVEERNELAELASELQEKADILAKKERNMEELQLQTLAVKDNTEALQKKLDAREKELNAKSADLAKREKALRARESKLAKAEAKAHQRAWKEPTASKPTEPSGLMFDDDHAPAMGIHPQGLLFEDSTEPQSTTGGSKLLFEDPVGDTANEPSSSNDFAGAHSPQPQRSAVPSQQQRNAEPDWIADESVSECMQCSARFSLRKRKHHCRKCGKIFCASCTKNKIFLRELGYPDKERVCDLCARQ
eukprot:TRINITY_DN11514_c0_g1_i1.p1 TRINITY_DN11514_c0_g1~~TRINITY_DN11514_c0_g1_i1.p1  ORF type:complete len:500 (-),score=119.05 TRINITY_DN11514_c0_g1_i1:87-1586(-)